MAERRPNARVTRVLYAVFVTGSAAFIVSSVWQIAAALFLPPKDASGEHVHVGEACGAALSALAEGVDRGVLAAAANADPDVADQTYRTSRGDAWAKKDELLRPCGAEPAGPEAMAALGRLDRAAESHVRRQSSELRPVRREVDSFIRASSK